MSVKEDKELIIPLYEKSIGELKEDLFNVKTEATRSLIVEEIEQCEKRLKFIKTL